MTGVTLGGASEWTGFLASLAVIIGIALRARSVILKKVIAPLDAMSGGDGRPPLPETVRKQGDAINAMGVSIAALTDSLHKVEQAMTLDGGRPMKEAVDRIEYKLDDHVAAYRAREADVSQRLTRLEDELHQTTRLKP